MGTSTHHTPFYKELILESNKPEISRIKSVQLFVRNIPRQTETILARKLLLAHLPNTPLTEIDVAENCASWEIFLHLHPHVTSTPQCIFVDENEVGVHIGGYEELVEFFKK